MKQDERERGFKMSKCQTCGAEVVWRETPTGSRMICNPKTITVRYPIRKGEKKIQRSVVLENGAVIVGALIEANPQASLLETPEMDTRQKYTGLEPHWGTCPQSKEWKGKKR